MLQLMHRRTRYWRQFMFFRFSKRWSSPIYFQQRLLQVYKKRTRYYSQIEFQRIATYGALAFADKSRLRYAYETHERNVREYFSDRPNDLLVMDILGGDGWDKVCNFLGRICPKFHFRIFQEGLRELEVRASK